MADTAFQTQFRQEFVNGFEVRRSLLSDTVTTEATVSGNQATFLVADSGDAEAVTRGANGKIPGRSDDLEQYTATLVEWHDKPQRSRFNVFAGQGDQRRLLQETAMAVMNRRIDRDIYDELNTATNAISGTVTMSDTVALRMKTKLQNAAVPWDSNVFALLSPAAEAYLLTDDSYANADYVETRPIPDGGNAWMDMPKVKNWLGVNWITHPNAPGAGTSAAKIFMWHKSSIGHAVDIAGMQTVVGYNEEDDYSFARCTCFMGPQILQQSGIVVVTHDDTAFS